MEIEKSDCFYVQPFKWEEDVERTFGTHDQVIHCWAKAIPATPDGVPLARETTTTGLFRVRNYPSKVSIIVPQTYLLRGVEKPVLERDVREIIRYFESWVTTMPGMKAIDREEYERLKGGWKAMVEHFETEYSTEYTPVEITFERRRRVYYYKRLPDGGEREDYVINLQFRNRTVAQKFSGAGADGFMCSSYIYGKKENAFVKEISGKIYKFELGFRGIDSVQKLLTERKVRRCGWFFVRDVTSAKAAERICVRGGMKTWINEFGSEIQISNHTPEFFMDASSVFPPNEEITRSLRSIPSVISWDIECYSDNHKAMPVAWNGMHVAYIITAVYQQYRKPETRIRKAFVFGRCDYETPTEADGKTSALVHCETETEMIDAFSRMVQDLNADVLIGYNIFGFDIHYLDIRLERNVRRWSNMGRLRENITHTGFTDWSSSAYGKNQLYWIEAPGRMCMDMMKIIERDYKFSDYKLETVSQALLGKGKNDVSPQEMFRIYESCLLSEPGCDAEMLKVVQYGIQDAVLPIELFEKINAWPFFIESANVMCVNPMDLFTRGQQLRLLNQFYDKCLPMGFVIDQRKVNIIEAEGAYVVPPIRGLHENVMTLDFASLYPSIMIAHNIGHDTLVTDPSIPDDQCHVFEWTDEEETTLNKEGNFEGVGDAEPKSEKKFESDSEYKIQKTADGKWRFRFIKVETGHRSICATMLVDLLGARKAVRSEQKKVKESDPVYWEILEQRQKAIKVSCNSVYGMTLAQETGKLPLAEGGICVTFRGRQLNLEMQRIARERYGAVTAYGDSVTGDTPVLVRDPIRGMRYENIEDLGLDWEEGYHGSKEFSRVPEGLEVWSERGFTRVENLIRHKCHKKIYRILTHTGCVDVTEDHSLLNEKAEKISPKEVVVGTELLHADLPNVQEDILEITEDGAYALGLFLAEGSCGSYDCLSGNKSSWAISNADVSVFEKTIRGLSAMHRGFEFKVLDTLTSSGAYKLVPISRGKKGMIRDLVKRYREMFYDRRSQKRLPNFIYRAPLSIRRAFWDGYYAGDGDRDKNGYVRCDARGKIGSAGLFFLASSLGYPVSVQTRTDKPNVFRMTCSRSTQRKEPNGVKKIIDMGYTDEYVYDFTTANHHFSAGVGRLVVHNTDSIMVKTAYTRLMVETARNFGEARPPIEEIHRLAEELGIKDYSEEIAERFLEHYHGFKEEYEVCNEMGDHIARDISAHLPKPISLEFENVFVKALFLMKKRYACIVLDRDKMVVKAHPGKMYTKGIMLARRDNCAWARTLFRDALFNLLMGKTRQEIGLIIHDHVHKLLTWRVSMTDLEIIQKLGFDYKSETFPLKLFSEHLVDIGKPARPNDRLAFVVSTTPNHLGGTDPKLGHHYRLSETLREEISRGENSINYLYYVERLKNDVDQIFSIGYMGEIEEFNRKRKARPLEYLEDGLKTMQEAYSEAEAEMGVREGELLTHTLNGTKKLEVASRRVITGLRRRMKALEAEMKKKTKFLELIHKKGMEEYVRKTRTEKEVLRLSLDDRFFEHVLEYLRIRRNLMKDIREWGGKKTK